MSDNFNRPLTLHVANSCKSTQWNKLVRTWDQLKDWHLKNPYRGKETLEEYMKLPKSDQDRLKDKGGYLIAAFNTENGRRVIDNILGLDALIYDVDDVPAGTLKDVHGKLQQLGYQFYIHTTRKHGVNGKERFRVIIRLNNMASPDEHDAVMRWIGAILFPGFVGVDPACFRSCQLYFWPTLCRDSKYEFLEGGYQILDKEDIKAAYSSMGLDWKNYAHRPQVPGTDKKTTQGIKPEDPTEKENIVGLFCQEYTIQSAIETFLPGVYIQCDTDENRYTYAQGSTAGGAVVYDDKWLYSHHATDPCNIGHLINAFDLVRIHLYGDKDTDAKPGTPANKLPSYLEMVKLAESNPKIAEKFKQMRLEKAKADFEGVIADKPPDNEVLEKFLYDYEGSYISLKAVQAAMETHNFKIRRNMIAGETEILGVPEKYSKGDILNTFPVILKDILKRAKITGVTDSALRGYLCVIADENRYNPVADMIRSKPWDKTSRIDTIYNVLGVSEALDKVLIRKWLIQCVAMAINDEIDPIGAEGVLTLQGDEGLGKTWFFKVIAYYMEWFVEGLTLDVLNKDSILKSINCWICELGELDSTSKKEQSGLKSHITARSDRVRVPYATAATHTARRTSYCATVNPEEFLTNNTGYRRFWVIHVTNIDKEALKRLEKDKEWIQQLWAEIYELWEADHNSFRLAEDELAQVMKRNEQFQLLLPGEEELRQILDWSLPHDQWQFIRAGAAMKLAQCSFRITSMQMGRVLAKVSKENPLVEKRDRQNSHEYLLPINLRG